MKESNKKTIKWVGLGFAILLIIFMFMKFNKEDNKENIKTPKDKIEANHSSTENKSIKNTVEFVSYLYGLEVNELKVINNPVGFKGNVIAPKETVDNGLNYIMNNIVKNEKLENVKVSLGEDTATINVNYKINNKIKTPVEMTIKPMINKDRDLQIEIKEVKFLDIKVFKWLVDFSTNKFIKEWIPEDNQFKIKFNDGNVIIDKSNFKGTTFNDVNIKPDNLNINLTFDLEKIMTNMESKYKEK
ncbi:hypothetical protein [[Clostridium] dakarense]|uniref:hypothetical protein n=1 Tax=Faecalimicrobium dakarense TaxID=1301100 RepID=UPI0004B79C80|nr:hypothetical protein [[Clostridium] dakarense]